MLEKMKCDIQLLEQQVDKMQELINTQSKQAKDLAKIIDLQKQQICTMPVRIIWRKSE